MQKQLTHGRMLVITDERQTAEVIRGLSSRRLVCLFGPRTQEEAHSTCMRAVVLALLAAKCSGFACFGPQSEVLHDAIDEIIVEQLIQGGAGGSEVTTTWHDDETVEDVAHFFISVIGADDGSLLVAVLSPTDDELRRALLTIADR